MKITRRRAVLSVLALAAVVLGVWLARNFKERLAAIPSRGGESFTMAAIVTPHYRQRDSRWENEDLGGLGESMARVGCTVCSLAMTLDFYGVKITPKELNDFLKKNDGYTVRGWLKWDSVSKVSNGQVTMDYIGKPSFKVIDRALKSNQPVIAKVFINGVIPHWVLIVGKEGTDYLMRDPLENENAVGRVSHYGSKIYAVRILKRNPPGLSSAASGF